MDSRWTGRIAKLTYALLLLLLVNISFAEQPYKTRNSATALLMPYAGPTQSGVNTKTLNGKVMTGYQGWFNCPGDGSGRGWGHYGRGSKFDPKSCTIDLWPDVSELSKEERFNTPFRHADGRVAQVFSSHQPKTVDRHFQWMKQYGIDGAFVQRFAIETRSTRGFAHCNRVLANCRAGANRHGRAYAVMYDLSGLRAGDTSIVKEDWKVLVDRFQFGRGNDKAYLHHHGKPVVAIWGVGFSEGRKYGLDECERLIRFLKYDPKYGGNTIMLGVPTYWRTLTRDSVTDKKLHDVLRLADIVSPWTVGRYAHAVEVSKHATTTMRPDIVWCNQRKQDYLPVVFPGFSWHNMYHDSPLGKISRQKGAFLWQQMVAAKQSGAKMIYVAMFDEVDEGTAIFKCTNHPPKGAGFLTYDGLPSDHYLWLTGQGRKMLRGEIGTAPPRR